MEVKDDTQSRNWAIEFYPDDDRFRDAGYSAEDYIKVIIKSVNASAYILHDKDLTEDGKTKKPHYHVMLHYTTPRTLKTIKNLYGVNYAEPVKYPKNHLLYFLHQTEKALNDNNKYKYDKNELKVKGIYYKKMLTDNFDLDFIKAVMDIDNKQEVTDFRSFVYFFTQEYPDMSALLMQRAYFVKNLINR